MSDLVTRQHEATRVSEVEGLVCSDLLAVYDQKTGAVGPLYLSIGGQWHRFYVDAGLLFWQEGQAPDSEDDLLGDDVYVPLADELRVRGVEIRRVEMDDSALTMVFENRAFLKIICGVQGEFATIGKRRAGER
jgi:hypothetical protein